MLGHGAFRDPAVYGAKLKRPLHWLASCLRVTGARTHGDAAHVAALARLGELPYQHPTPEGYPERGDAWTGTLWWRWRTAWDLAHEHDAVLDPLLVLGRRPNAAEQAAWEATTDPAERRALLLSCPSFQRC